ncbi:MAG: right-handed parallel beta-helix repeat-containing protein, partial [Synergistaceae bacterium]|nr:right-handed parallel beta-helix repeat-containing protein [Synergistaceae bacterium]
DSESVDWAGNFISTDHNLNKFVSEKVKNDNDKVYVLSGEYKLTSAITDNSKKIKFYGGFSGSETSIESRDIFNNPTKIIQTGKNNNISVFHLSGSSLVDGFIITRENKSYSGNGINIHRNVSSLLIQNCVITGNSASVEGGGLCVGSKSTAEIKNCRIENNFAVSNGAGIYTYANSNLTISNSTVINNNGGGIFINGSATITNSTISNNNSKQGVYCEGNADITLNNCTLVNNSSGEIYSNNGTITLNNSIIFNSDINNFISGVNISYDKCAFPENSINDSALIFISSDWEPVSADSIFNGVQHKIFPINIEGNYKFLKALKNAGKVLESSDQIGVKRWGNTTIGAIEANAELISLSLDIFASSDDIAAGKVLFSKDVTGKFEDDTERILTSGDFLISWDMTPNNIEGIKFENEVLTVSDEVEPGYYEVKISAVVFSNDVESPKAEKIIKITIEEKFLPSLPGLPDSPDIPDSPDVPEIPAHVESSDPEKLSSPDENININITDVVNDEITEIKEPDTIPNYPEKIEISSDTAMKENFENPAPVIKTLDLSKVDFNGIADLTNIPASIEIVEISNNPTVKIILLRNSSIKILSVQNCCNLESLDIENNSSLETLNFSNCKVNENSFLILNCENLKSLIFSRNEFLRFDYDEKILPNLSELVCSPQIKILKSPISLNSPNITNLNVNDSIITYDYITGFNDVKMNVIIILDVDSEYDSDKNNSSGCSVINVGKLAIIMTLNLIFMFLRKKENFYGRCSSFSNGVSRKNRQG